MFLRACKEQMKISSSDIFTLTDLYNDNTTGFVKVTKLVNRRTGHFGTEWKTSFLG